MKIPSMADLEPLMNVQRHLQPYNYVRLDELYRALGRVTRL